MNAHNFGNQFTNYQGHNVAALYVRRFPNSPEMQEIRALVKDYPDRCIVPSARRTSFRVDGRIYKITRRALAYMAHFGYVPECGFGVAICRTPDCVNPLHQAPLGTEHAGGTGSKNTYTIIEA